MADTVTLLTLRTKVRTRGEFLDPFVTDTELTGYVNDSIAELYDELLKLDPSRYRTASSNIAVVSGTGSYDISSAAATFYQLLGVEVADSRSSTGWVNLDRYNFDERNDYELLTEKTDARYELRGGYLYLHPVPTWSANVRLIFIPVPVALSADGDTWDSVNKWTEWVVLDCLVKCAHKEGSVHSADRWEKRRDRKLMSIMGIAEVDQGQPKTRVDVYRHRGLAGRRYRRWD